MVSTSKQPSFPLRDALSSVGGEVEEEQLLSQLQVGEGTHSQDEVVKTQELLQGVEETQQPSHAAEEEEESQQPSQDLLAQASQQVT